MAALCAGRASPAASGSPLALAGALVDRRRRGALAVGRAGVPLTLGLNYLREARRCAASGRSSRASSRPGRVPRVALVPVGARRHVVCGRGADRRARAAAARAALLRRRRADGVHAARISACTIPPTSSRARRSGPLVGRALASGFVKVGIVGPAERRQVDALQRARRAAARRRPSTRSRPSSRTSPSCRCPTSGSSGWARRSASSAGSPSTSRSSTSPGSCAAPTRARVSATASSATSATSTRSCTSCARSSTRRSRTRTARSIPLQDLETVEAELLLADLESAERRLEAATKAARSGDKDGDRRARAVGAHGRGAVRRPPRARPRRGC